MLCHISARGYHRVPLEDAAADIDAACMACGGAYGLQCWTQPLLCCTTASAGALMHSCLCLEPACVRACVRLVEGRVLRWHCVCVCACVRAALCVTCSNTVSVSVAAMHCGFGPVARWHLALCGWLYMPRIRCGVSHPRPSARGSSGVCFRVGVGKCVLMCLKLQRPHCSACCAMLSQAIVIMTVPLGSGNLDWLDGNVSG